MSENSEIEDIKLEENGASSPAAESVDEDSRDSTNTIESTTSSSRSSLMEGFTFEKAIEYTLYGVKKAVGAKMYYAVWQLLFRPIFFMSQAATLSSDFTTATGNKGTQTLLLGIGAAAFATSLPFMLIKFDQASYMAKIHYPFLLSSALGDKLKRETMFEMYQLVEEEISICTILLGSLSEFLLIVGSGIIVLGLQNQTEGGGTNYATAAAQFTLSLQAFYENIIKCMEIMAYRGKQVKCTQAWCGLCYMCLNPESYEFKNLIGSQKDELKKLEDSDTRVYTFQEVPNQRYINFQTETYLKYMKHNKENELIVDFEKCQSTVLKDKTGKSYFEFVDRYGFLTIPGYTQLLIWGKYDKNAHDKKNTPTPPPSENPEEAKPSGLNVGWIMNSLSAGKVAEPEEEEGSLHKFRRRYTDWWAKAFVAYGYVCGEGFLRVMTWLWCGLDVRRAVLEACKKVAQRGEELHLTEEEIADLSSGLYSDRIMCNTVQYNDGTQGIKEVMKEIKRPMPYGFSILSPLKRLHPCCYPFLTTINPFYFHYSPRKYELNRKNMININVIAEIILRCNVMIPHDFFQAFPMNIWPLSKVYPALLLTIAAGLQKLRDMIELYELRGLGYMDPAPVTDTSEMTIREYIEYLVSHDDTEPTQEAIDYVKSHRAGEIIHIADEEAAVDEVINPITIAEGEDLDSSLSPAEALAASKTNKNSKKYNK